VPRRDSRRRDSARSSDEESARTSSDDGGCLVVLFLVLWYFGFISFHWRREAAPAAQVADVRAQLAKAQTQLGQVTTVANALRADSAALNARRVVLLEQVTRLERTRDEIGATLAAATRTMSPGTVGKWRERGDAIFTGIAGNLLTLAITSGAAWWLGRRAGRKAAG
jgi:hypothetical protein